MLLTEIKRCRIAVIVALSGSMPPERICRFFRCRVVFPDIGFHFIESLGFLRYPGERSLVFSEATGHEVTLTPGLTIHL